MGKWMLIGAMSCLFLTACSTQADNNTEVQQLKVENDKLQKEVAQLQLDPNKTQAATNDTKQIQDFKNEVTSIVEKANNTKPVGAKEENLNTYLAAKKEIDQLDDKIDLSDNQLEADYHAGTITVEQNQTQEKEHDILEDQLEQAENALEARFGIDD
ncbi:lipoprotein [Bacillus cereus BAG1X2-3]|uniref:Lipoprotein n=1 Tax=Bacillus cereus TaxID=1396 RepID=A0A9X7E0I2_BACCE|nr:lipoprotein [Bacillus cereus]EOO28566.1 lipoprotein [Bacillus cereus BAG1X1-1]EOO47977.1 lipoprotein [Bacillus cereus BAG1X2-1]EOO53318.1 lipoprotein [Bacillus cereus BAG1X2-2]EOO58941.1 lipoprotein [Bacillus cereus BAG1X2-3]EOP04950.1 lipoprotein [Bacillus cereus BAG2O-1]